MISYFYKKKLIVFINKKLISIDAILPLIYELKYKKKSVSIEIWCPDTVTLDDIKKNNFLYDQASKVANFFVIKNYENESKFYKLLCLFLLLLRISIISISCFIGNITFIHFKLLNNWPFRLLYFLNKKKTFFAESGGGGFGVTNTMNDLDKGKKDSSFTKVKTNPGNLLIFDNSVLDQTLSNFKKNNQIYVGVPKLRNIWVKTIIKNSEKYFYNELNKFNSSSDQIIIAVLLGYFGGLPHQINNNIQIQLLKNTLEVLNGMDQNILVMLKPHVITNINTLTDIINLFPNLNSKITYLHPMILASKTKLVIANDYTTALCDFKVMGVPTIEYGGYTSVALDITGGGSIRPAYIDYFINNDKQLFKKTLVNLLNSKSKHKKIKYNHNSVIFDKII